MTIRRRRPGPIFLAAILLTAVLPVTAAAVGSSAQASLSPRSLPTWAHGSITGAGPHNGVRLVLVAWPGRKVRVGQKVQLQVVGKATSSGSGSYAIRSTVTLPKGLHNLEVLARSSAAVGTFSFARRVGRGGRALVAVDGSASTGPVEVNIRMMALPKSAVPAVPHPGLPCILPKKIREFGKKMVDIGGLYSIGMPRAEMVMTYAEGSTTTIGVDVSIPLAGDSFTAGGTFTETKTGTEGFTPQFGAEENMQTPYTFGEYNFCGVIDQVQPETWATGQHTVTVLAPAAVKCSSHFPAGGTFTTSNETAGTFTAGVNLKKEIGVNLSAQSGYNKDTSITWTFPHGGGYLCGTNNFPSLAAWNVMDVSSSGNPLPRPVKGRSPVKRH